MSKFHQRQEADRNRFTATWQTGYRGPAAWDEEPEPAPEPPRPQPRPQETPEPAPQPAATATDQRKRRLAEAARERRKRQRPTNAAEIIRGRCEPCTVEEASSVDVVREALKAAGCNKTDLSENGLNSSNRRQRGTDVLLRVQVRRGAAAFQGAVEARGIFGSRHHRKLQLPDALQRADNRSGLPGRLSQFVTTLATPT